MPKPKYPKIGETFKELDYPDAPILYVTKIDRIRKEIWFSPTPNHIDSRLSTFLSDFPSNFRKFP